MSALYIGLMSGTSLDGVDGVLMSLAPGSPVVLAESSLPFPAHLRHELLALNLPGEDELHRAAAAAHQLALLYAETVTNLLRLADVTASQVCAIGAHGQTVRHHPPGAHLRQRTVCASTPDFPPYTLQLNHPATLAEMTGITVVADFRSRDIAAGGQGAPLVPAFHRQVFGLPGQAVAVVNIGGMANLTALTADGRVLGLDTGPGNVLLDLWCAQHTGRDFDAGGAWGATGTVCNALLERMLAEPYFVQSGIKSTGRDLFNATWLEQHLRALPPVAPADVQATLVALTAKTVAQAIESQAWGGLPPKEVLVCGGGARNTHLMQRLQQYLPAALVMGTSERGWPETLVEAAAFAWLAQQTVEHRPGNEPQVTGAAGQRILGAIYPA